MSKIICLTNQKGGVGKTTTCVNLAAYVAAAGHKVLLIDLDPQGNASAAVGVEKLDDKNSIYQVIVGDCQAKDATYPCVVPNLSVIPATVDFAGAEIDLLYMDNRERVLKEALAPIRNEYEYIFIDCPPSLGLITVNALTATDSIIIPIQCEYFALVGLGQLMNTVRLIKQQELNPGIEIEGVLLTMKDNRSNLVKDVSDEIHKYFKSKVYATTIPRNVRLAEAPSHGLPIFVYDPKAKGAIAYEELSEEFLKNQKK